MQINFANVAASVSRSAHWTAIAVFKVDLKTLLAVNMAAVGGGGGSFVVVVGKAAELTCSGVFSLSCLLFHQLYLIGYK